MSDLVRVEGKAMSKEVELFFVAHYGIERTVFHWLNGDKMEVYGYCTWHNGGPIAHDMTTVNRSGK